MAYAPSFYAAGTNTRKGPDARCAGITQTLKKGNIAGLVSTAANGAARWRGLSITGVFFEIWSDRVKTKDYNGHQSLGPIGSGHRYSGPMVVCQQAKSASASEISRPSPGLWSRRYRRDKNTSAKARADHSFDGRFASLLRSHSECGRCVEIDESKILSGAGGSNSFTACSDVIHASLAIFRHWRRRAKERAPLTRREGEIHEVVRRHLVYRSTAGVARGTR